MVQINLSYTTCFLQEPVADYLCCLPLSLVDLCLSGTQVYNTHILVCALTRLTHLEHLRLNGLATITDDAIERVCLLILIDQQKKNNLIFHNFRYCVLLVVD